MYSMGIKPGRAKKHGETADSCGYFKSDMRNKKYIHNFGRNGKVKVDVQRCVREIRGEELLCVVRQQLKWLPVNSESAIRFPVLQKILRPYS